MNPIIQDVLNQTAAQIGNLTVQNALLQANLKAAEARVKELEAKQETPASD